MLGLIGFVMRVLADGILAVREMLARDPSFEHLRTAGTPSLLDRDSGGDGEMVMWAWGGLGRRAHCIGC